MELRNFIVIEGSEIDLFLAKKAIDKSGLCKSLTSFVNGQDALDYIEKNVPDTEHPTILLVTLYGPVMNAWEFIDAFSKVPQEIREHYVPCIVSASIDPTHLLDAKKNPLIKGFLTKPLTATSITSISS